MTCKENTPPNAQSLKLKMTSEPVLDGVPEEDRVTVRNIVYLLFALKMCSSWSVTPKSQGYEVVGIIDTKATSEIELRDMDLIKRVDPLRIMSVSARMIGGPNTTFSVVIFLLRKSEPVILEEQEIVQIQRKRKFWNGFGAS